MQSSCRFKDRMVFAIDFLNERKSQGCPVREDVYNILFPMKMNVNSQNGLGDTSNQSTFVFMLDCQAEYMRLKYFLAPRLTGSPCRHDILHWVI